MRKGRNADMTLNGDHFALTLMGQPLSHIKGRGFLSHCLCVYGFVPAEVTQPMALTTMTQGSLGGVGTHRGD